MNKMTFHDQDEFNNIDWDSLKHSTKNEEPNYLFLKGDKHNNFGDGWFIGIYDEDDGEDIYKLPTALNKFIEYAQKEGEENIINGFKTLFRINKTW